MRVTLKLATSLDGKIATASGESRWITGEAARGRSHRLRAANAAVLVGVRTVIADDPELTVRLPGYDGPQPARVVLDSLQRIPMNSKLVRTAREIPVIVVAGAAPKAKLTEAGVKVLQAPRTDAGVDAAAALAALEAEGIDSVMIEGGGQVAASFIAADLVDALEWFRAPFVIGDDGLPGVAGFPLQALAEAPHFRRIGVEVLGADLWERYERA